MPLPAVRSSVAHADSAGRFGQLADKGDITAVLLHLCRGKLQSVQPVRIDGQVVTLLEGVGARDREESRERQYQVVDSFHRFWFL